MESLGGRAFCCPPGPLAACVVVVIHQVLLHLIVIVIQ